MIVSRKLFLALALLGIWLGVCYGVRFQVMENSHWVAVCDGKSAIAMCDVRALLGRIIHLRALVWIALLCAIPAFFIRGVIGRKLAWIGLFATAPALVLYTVTPAVFSALIAALRLVRNEHQSATASNKDAPAQPNA